MSLDMNHDQSQSSCVQAREASQAMKVPKFPPIQSKYRDQIDYKPMERP
jgi:hypothetical protein